MTQLTQKEKLLLQDLKSQEELCIKKYSKGANETTDQVLKQILTQLGNQEQQHLNTVNQIMQGQMSTSQQSPWQQSQQSQPSGGQQQQGTQSQMQGSQSGMQNQQSSQQIQFNFSNLKSQSAQQTDFDLVHDLLSTEKYVSSTYNTAIFEFNDSNIRQTLNHIQKEEQQHGEILYNYMKQNGAYQQAQG
ncbi:MAG: spore coat protein [Candidatus Gastranaerophilales bacterium]|nr:spore coat protein [Candidatus Gastranaerophilales bacterium]